MALYVDTVPDDRHGARILENGVPEVRIWAPRAESVSLVTWTDGERREQAMDRDGNGFFAWRGEPGSFDEGARYAFRRAGSDLDLPDPASRWQPDGVHQASALLDPRKFAWTDDAWTGLRRNELAIYELHIGTFTPEGTFAAAAERLPQLAELGVTAVELMPVNQFPGTRNWGYDGVHPYAVQNSYGGPHGLQRFVDAAHRLGLGVILDVVYNHLGPEGNYLGHFGPYFTDRYHTPWGEAINFDGRDSDPVRRFFIDAACQWVVDFHVDGLRLDAVQTMFDLGARPILAELQDAVHSAADECGRAALVIAESNQNDVRIATPLEQGGLGLDGVWADDFHHAVHSWLTGETVGYYADFGGAEPIVKALNDAFVYDGCHSRFRGRRHGNPAGDCPRERFVVCIQNHDQVGNRVGSERLSAIAPPEAVRSAAALMLLAPFTPLLFMGEEYGETRPFPFFSSFTDEPLIDAVRRGRRREFAEQDFCRDYEPPDPHAFETFASAVLAWDWPNDPVQAGLRHLYQVLLAARRTCPALVDRRHTAARLADDEPRLLVLQRGRAPSLTAWLNLSAETIPFDIGRCGGRPILFSTAEERFGGRRPSLDEPDELLPYELIVAGDDVCRMPLS